MKILSFHRMAVRFLNAGHDKKGRGETGRKRAKAIKQSQNKGSSAEVLTGEKDSENRLAENKKKTNQGLVDGFAESISAQEKRWNEKQNIIRWITCIVVLILSIILFMAGYIGYRIYRNGDSMNTDGAEIKRVVGDIILQNGNSDKRIDVIMETIMLCTNQLEDYDKSNLDAGMSCIGFIGIIITAVGAIMAAITPQNRAFFNQAVSVILLFIPEMFVVFLYNFSMSCRRSAIYRGYLVFLEEILNEELGADYMLFNQQLIPKWLSNFSVNTNGPIVLAAFLIIIISLFFVVSYYFARQSKNFIFFCCYNAFFVFLCALCIICSCWYGAYLTTNGKVIDGTKAMCEKTLSEWNMSR